MLIKKTTQMSWIDSVRRTPSEEVMKILTKKRCYRNRAALLRAALNSRLHVYMYISRSNSTATPISIYQYLHYYESVTVTCEAGA